MFYTGTHQPHWLGLWNVPLFVSRRRLCARVSLPRASAPWALDSGGFTELDKFGYWTVTEKQYIGEARRYAQEIGRMTWAAPQDWMCEPKILANTGKTVEEHQRLTVQSYLSLMENAPDVPWIPVLQGWVLADYMKHIEDYRRAGVDVTALPVVGVGSVCRRQHSQEIADIFRLLHGAGVRCHGFGVKLKGLEKAAQYMVSSDSMAWSYAAVYDPPLPGCVGHKNCANCMKYAKRWRNKVVNVQGVGKWNRTDFLRGSA